MVSRTENAYRTRRQFRVFYVAPKAPSMAPKAPPLVHSKIEKRRERETGEMGEWIRMREVKSTLVTLNPKKP